MPRWISKTCGSRRGTDWSGCPVTDVTSTVSGGTVNGGFASRGDKEEQRVLNSSTTTDQVQNSDMIEPIHPGAVLMEDFIEGRGIPQHKVAQHKGAVAIGVPPRRINGIVHGKRGITADTAIRLARYFGTSEESWMNLQSNCELRKGHQALGDRLAEIEPLVTA